MINEIVALQSFQERHYPGGRCEASTAPHYTVPNFYKVARAYGVRADVISLNPVSEQIQGVLDADGAVICSVECPDFCQYEPSITGWACPIEDMNPALPRDEFQENMIIDPLPGWETGEYR